MNAAMGSATPAAVYGGESAASGAASGLPNDTSITIEQQGGTCNVYLAGGPGGASTTQTEAPAAAATAAAAAAAPAPAALPAALPAPAGALYLIHS